MTISLTMRLPCLHRRRYRHTYCKNHKWESSASPFRKDINCKSRLFGTICSRFHMLCHHGKQFHLKRHWWKEEIKIEQTKTGQKSQFSISVAHSFVYKYSWNKFSLTTFQLWPSYDHVVFLIYECWLRHSSLHQDHWNKTLHVRFRYDGYRDVQRFLFSSLLQFRFLGLDNNCINFLIESFPIWFFQGQWNQMWSN